MRTTLRVTLQISETGIQSVSLEGKRVRQIERLELPRRDQAIIGDDRLACRKLDDPLISRYIRNAVIRMKSEHDRHRLRAQIGDGHLDLQHTIGESVRHFIFVGEWPLSHQFGMLPELELAGD